MRTLRNTFFYIAFAMIISSFFLKLFELPGQAVLMFFGSIGITIFFLAKSIKDFMTKSTSKDTFHQILIALMAATLFFRYWDWAFWDIPGFIIIPLFILFSIIYQLMKGQWMTLDIKAKLIIITFSLMSIPLFISYENSPRKYIPETWLSHDINSSKFRNEKWSWFVNKDSGEGEWVKIGTIIDNMSGDYSMFFSNGVIREKGRVENGIFIDTSYTFDINEKLIKYKIYINDNDVIDYYINNGNYTSYYKTGEIESKGIVINHKASDNWTNYYESGSILLQNYVLRDTSIKTDYYENGMIMDSMIYVNNKRNGISKQWYSNGKNKKSTIWKEGQRNGIAMMWFSNGNLKNKVFWKNGLMEGENLIWFENGQLGERSFRKKGKIEGELVQWHEYGQIKAKLNYKNDLADGEFIYYHENGQIKGHSFFKNQIPLGISETFYDNGNIKRSIERVNGKIEGLIKDFYENSQLREQSTWMNDVQNGDYSKWYENGNLEYTAFYKNGRMEGESRFYNEDGALFKVETYKNGEIIN